MACWETRVSTPAWGSVNPPRPRPPPAPGSSPGPSSGTSDPAAPRATPGRRIGGMNGWMDQAVPARPTRRRPPPDRGAARCLAIQQLARPTAARRLRGRIAHPSATGVAATTTDWWACTPRIPEADQRAQLIGGELAEGLLAAGHNTLGPIRGLVFHRRVPAAVVVNHVSDGGVVKTEANGLERQQKQGWSCVVGSPATAGLRAT
jgi:hypothetical protein